MRASYFLWGALAIGVGVSLFLLKYKVQALENELVARQEQVVRDRAAIRVLQAEWTYLNDPERLRRLSAEHLGFGPATPRNIADISALPFRAGAEGTAQAPHPNEKSTAEPGTAPTPQADIAIGTQARRAGAPAPERPGVGPVIFARLQRLLFPAEAGAATYPAVAPPRPAR